MHMFHRHQTENAINDQIQTNSKIHKIYLENRKVGFNANHQKTRRRANHRQI